MSPFHIDHAKLVLHVLYIVGFWNTYITMFCLNAYACTHAHMQPIMGCTCTRADARTHKQNINSVPKLTACIPHQWLAQSKQTFMHLSGKRAGSWCYFVWWTPGGRRKHAIELCLGKATMWTCWQGIFQLTATWTRFRTTYLDSGLARGCM